MSRYPSHLLHERKDIKSGDTQRAFPNINKDPALSPSSLDPFTVTARNGFLPMQPPLTKLPPAFDPLTKLLDNMSIKTSQGLPGMLASYQLGPTIDNGTSLPDLTSKIDDLTTEHGEWDLVAVTATFRDYSFLASAYLLEPCWESFREGRKGYGLGRDVLPRCIAGPLVKTAELLDIPPYLSYAASYALFNYYLADPTVGLSAYENLRLIRAFEHGHDPKSSEAGFILTHVDMVKHTGGLVQGTVQLLDAVAAGSGPHATADAFEVLLETMRTIEASMEDMWSHSKPKDYISYRTFLFGITNQSMFPNGVIYEGVQDNRPMFFRGESGANDTIIPLLDGLLQIPMPENALTDILKDFRNYRPKPHREFLAHVRRRAEELDVKAYCCQNMETTGLYLRLLNHVRSFRWRHWLFAREYILKRTQHPTASGGSPIVTWLPNQLFAVMELMTQIWHDAPAEMKSADKELRAVMESVRDSYDKLQKEVERYCQERGV